MLTSPYCLQSSKQHEIQPIKLLIMFNLKFIAFDFGSSPWQQSVKAAASIVVNKRFVVYLPLQLSQATAKTFFFLFGRQCITLGQIIVFIKTGHRRVNFCKRRDFITFSAPFFAFSFMGLSKDSLVYPRCADAHTTALDQHTLGR